MACGSNKNAARILGVAKGDVLYDFKDSQDDIGKSPAVLVDAAHNGKTGLIGTANGNIYVKNMQVGGPTSDDDDDDEMHS